jgi:hypothetical protein
MVDSNPISLIKAKISKGLKYAGRCRNGTEIIAERDLPIRDKFSTGISACHIKLPQVILNKRD